MRLPVRGTRASLVRLHAIPRRRLYGDLTARNYAGRVRAWPWIGVIAGFSALLLGASEPTQSGVFTAPPPADRLPVWSPDGASIAFATNRDAAAGGREVELLALGYGQAVHVVTQAGEERRLALLDPLDAFSISPDWRSLGVVGSVQGGYALFTMNLDGSDRRRLADASPLEAPSWAPDAARLAFAGPDATVRVIRSDGTGLVSLGEGVAPLWSPDGSKIAFRSVSPQGLAVMDADGRGRKMLATGVTARPSWSPDSTRIAFHAGEGRISIVEMGSGRRHDLDVNALTNAPPAWSPTGDRIAFVLLEPRKSRIAVVESDGGAPRSLTKAPAGWDATWSPDGTKLAYSDVGACGRSGIHVVDVATTKDVRLTSDCRIFGTPRADGLVGTALVDIVDAGAGNDTVAAKGGDDVVRSGAGRDRVNDGPGRDLILGGPGPDILHGDRLLGGPGRDRLYGTDGWRADINARDGERDWVYCGSPRRDTVIADRFDRVARNCEFVTRK
jgi:Tol biopolymer transport system component